MSERESLLYARFRAMPTDEKIVLGVCAATCLGIVAVVVYAVAVIL